jgi:hypothetical protein
MRGKAGRAQRQQPVKSGIVVNNYNFNRNAEEKEATASIATFEPRMPW